MMSIPRTIAGVVIFLAAGAGDLCAQAPWRWHAWNRDRPNILVAGLGANAALAGLRYARTIGDTPLSLGIGASSEGYVPYVEVTAADGFSSSGYAYVGVGALVGWDRNTRNAPLLEFGERTWLGHGRRVFMELGVAVVQFRDYPLLLLPLVFPHVQLGVTF